MFRQPEYVHVLLNHLPLTGLAVALLALLVGMVLRNLVAMRVGLGLAGLMSFCAWPVFEYGEKAYDRVYAMADEEGRSALEKHRALADSWTKLYYVTTAIAFIGLGLSWKWPQRLQMISWIVILLAMLSLVQGIRVAIEGGKIRHREFRH